MGVAKKWWLRFYCCLFSSRKKVAEDFGAELLDIILHCPKECEYSQKVHKKVAKMRDKGA